MTAAALDDRLDRLAEQMALLTAELEEQRRRRHRWESLADEATPVIRQLVDSGSRNLDLLEVDSEDVINFSRTALRVLPKLESLLIATSALSDLATMARDVTNPAVEMLTVHLGELDRRGYPGFAREVVRIADRVVTSFSEEEVAALGDNIVLILETIKEMTQPEIMAMVGRTIQTVQEVDETAKVPSLFGLARSMRDPQTRRGLARALMMLRSMGEAPAGPEKGDG